LNSINFFSRGENETKTLRRTFRKFSVIPDVTTALKLFFLTNLSIIFRNIAPKIQTSRELRVSYTKDDLFAEIKNCSTLRHQESVQLRNVSPASMQIGDTT
jgi:hypothetical protein